MDVYDQMFSLSSKASLQPIPCTLQQLSCYIFKNIEELPAADNTWTHNQQKCKQAAPGKKTHPSQPCKATTTHSFKNAYNTKSALVRKWRTFFSNFLLTHPENGVLLTSQLLGFQSR